MSKVKKSIKCNNTILNSQAHTLRIIKNMDPNCELIKTIISNHPNSEKVKDVRSVYIGKDNGYRIVDSYGNIDSISIKKCIKNLFSPSNYNYKKYNVIQAFRKAIHLTSRLNFIIENCKCVNNSLINDSCTTCGSISYYDCYCSKLWIGVCDECKENDISITVDHCGKKFRDIFNDFLKVKDLKIENIETIKNNQFHSISDDTIRREWIQYHDNIVKWRILCNSCNSSLR